jgi:hypothetical protein
MNRMGTQTFPKELLKAQASEKLKYFKGITIGHPNIEEARERLLNAIEDANPDFLIFVFGPTGVGKSTLRISAMNTVISKMLPELQIDLERIPIVGLELHSPAGGSFNWADMFERLLSEMNEPLIEYKIPARTVCTHPALSAIVRPSVSKYCQAYESAMKHRRPVATILDDAHYFNKVPGNRLQHQLDFVKSVAGDVRIPHVLFGTYELLALRNLSGQISRRSIDIHFPRYGRRKGDRDIFAGVLMTFAHAMPIEECPDLVEHLDYLMERSVGCVGILKTWLELSLADALRSGAKTVTKKHLERQSYSNEALTKMFMEAAEGEERLLQGDGEYNIQAMRLNASGSDFMKNSDGTARGNRNSSRDSRQGRPGQRRPARDPIGREKVVEIAN